MLYHLVRTMDEMGIAPFDMSGEEAKMTNWCVWDSGDTNRIIFNLTVAEARKKLQFDEYDRMAIQCDSCVAGTCAN